MEFFIWIIVIILIIGGIVKWRNIYVINRFDPSSKYPSFFTPQLMARFPKEDIYYVPEEVGRRNKIAPDDIEYGEGHPYWWEEIIKNYPTPPSSSSDQHEREQRMWCWYADFFSVKHIERPPVLKPDQEIMDYARIHERWLYREYYAVTGILRRSIVEELCYLELDVARAYATGDQTNPERAKADDAMKHFTRHTYPDHCKQAGGWFLFNVREAFERANEPPTVAPPIDDGDSIEYVRRRRS